MTVRIVALCQVTKNHRITLPPKVTKHLDVDDFDSIMIIQNEKGELVLMKAI